MASMRSLAAVLWLAAMLSPGCGGASHESDSGAPGLDAASEDAALVDAALVDAALVDTGSGDAGTDAHVDPPGDAWSAPDASLEAGSCTPHECGDGACDGGESCVDCPRDCGACTCGDGTCEGAETCAGCPSDCGSCPCGDGTCAVADGESCVTCAADCACTCGDGNCGPREWEICGGSGIGDCGFVDFCGNRVCEDAHAETCLNCPIDCCC